MPAKVRKQGGKWQCWNPEDGKVYGTHKTRQEAMAQMKALYANIPDIKEGKR